MIGFYAIVKIKSYENINAQKQSGRENEKSAILSIPVMSSIEVRVKVISSDSVYKPISICNPP